MKPEIYRRIIDRLAEVSRTGQGQVASNRALSGLWNQNATEARLPDQHNMNLLLAGLSVEQRAVLATMLRDQFICGVFETLKVLEKFQIEPFLDGYEGSPYHDFIGRVADEPWEWPNVPE